ncbi:MAG TPA: hemolysin III family protein [Acidimicrobiia bacterium]|nr:hemolysin III family protein [Acidimicrobiia bacterium]
MYAQAQRFPEQPRPRLRGRLHAVAAALAVAALAWLVRSAASLEATVAAWIYGVSSLLCYLTSSLYHIAARTERARAILRRADHSMIYLFIAGSFTPPCLLTMSGWWRWPLISVVWAGALLGVGLTIPARPRLRRFAWALYLILGWVGVTALPALARDPLRATLVATAGLLYTGGAVLFARQRPVLHPGWFGYHEFWHGIGIIAGALVFAVNLSLIATPVS